MLIPVSEKWLGYINEAKTRFVQGSEIKTRVFKAARQAHLQLILTQSRHSRLFREPVLKGKSGEGISQHFRSSMGFRSRLLFIALTKVRVSLASWTRIQVKKYRKRYLTSRKGIYLCEDRFLFGCVSGRFFWVPADCGLGFWGTMLGIISGMESCLVKPACFGTLGLKSRIGAGFGLFLGDNALSNTRFPA